MFFVTGFVIWGSFSVNFFHDNWGKGCRQFGFSIVNGLAVGYRGSALVLMRNHCCHTVFLGKGK